MPPAQEKPELLAEIRALRSQCEEVETSINLAETGTATRLSAVGRMRAEEERRRKMKAEGKDPDTGKQADPAAGKNELYVLGFRVAFVALVLGGGAYIASLLAQGQ